MNKVIVISSDKFFYVNHARNYSGFVDAIVVSSSQRAGDAIRVIY